MENIELQPPHVNGDMVLSDSEKNTITDKLIAIRDSFVPTEDLPFMTTMYLVSEYNSKNSFQINGDTAEMLLSEVGA
jgi:hypothetical protein